MWIVFYGCWVISSLEYDGIYSSGNVSIYSTWNRSKLFWTLMKTISVTEYLNYEAG